MADVKRAGQVRGEGIGAIYESERIFMAEQPGLAQPLDGT